MRKISFILLSENQKCRLFKHFDSYPLKKYYILIIYLPGYEKCEILK